MLQHQPEPSGARFASGILLAASLLFFALHYVHLRADFPHYSPWPDPARVTDEGWYAGAAVRQILSGHWHMPGDFNPAVALPVFPALVYATFRLTGVSMIALRALNVTCFGASLIVLWLLVRRYGSALTAASAVFLCATSPFLYAYSRLGIVEPLLILESLLILLAASYVTGEGALRRWSLASVAVGVMLTLSILTKTTSVCLIPAVFFLMFASCGFTWKRFWRPATVSTAVACALGAAYFAAVVHAGLTRDFRDLFAINQSRIHGRILLPVLWQVFQKGAAIGPTFYFVSIIALVSVLLFLRRDLPPLLVAAALGIAGYGAFITYHGWLMERYYLVPTPLVAIVLVLSLARLANSGVRTLRWLTAAVTIALVISCIAQIRTVLLWESTPNYSYARAADSIYGIIDRDPSDNHVLLSHVSEELALFSGEPGIFINDVYGTAPLRERLLRYHPGWLIEFDKTTDQAEAALDGLYSKQLVDSEPAFGDDGEHFRIYLYKLSLLPPTPTAPYLKSPAN